MAVKCNKNLTVSNLFSPYSFIQFLKKMFDFLLIYKSNKYKKTVLSIFRFECMRRLHFESHFEPHWRKKAIETVHP